MTDLRPYLPGVEAAAADMRVACLETAFIELLDRVVELERMLRFETDQRAAMETFILPISGLPRRVDRLERDARACRKGCNPTTRGKIR